MKYLTKVKSTLACCLILINLFSCTDSEIIFPAIEPVVSFEVYQSQDLIEAIVFENNNFPCANSNNCVPKILRNQTLTIRSDRVGGRKLNFKQNIYTSFKEFDLDYNPGEEITFQAVINLQTYTATEKIPDPSKMVINVNYNVSLPNVTPGLYIEFDGLNLPKAEALYIQVVTDSVISPTYGYVITGSLQQSALIPRNGFADPNSKTIYSVPDFEFKHADPKFSIAANDTFGVVIRTITKSSADFYLAYRRAIINGEFSLNDGLFFAPPENLPTNFDNDGFGMFHVFHQQLMVGVAL